MSPQSGIVFSSPPTHTLTFQPGSLHESVYLALLGDTRSLRTLIVAPPICSRSSCGAASPATTPP